jgi:hypothetical protein
MVSLAYLQSESETFVRSLCSETAVGCGSSAGSCQELLSCRVGLILLLQVDSRGFAK